MTYRIPIFSSFLLALALLLQQSLDAAPPNKVTVTDAQPEEALQGEMLPVVISGENFDAGSTVRFLVTGTDDDSQIQVGAVDYNPDGSLTADIQVRDDALVFEYDVEVRTFSGRRGKGTSLFRVRQKLGDPAPVILAGWSGGTGAEDLFARDCTSDSNSSGIYDCDLIGEVQFNLTGGELISRKGSQDWCDSFNVRTTGNTNYRLYGGGDSGDCTTGNCTIGILNTSVGTHDVNVANGWPADVGLLIIKANWDIPAPSTGVNPFADPLVLDEANWLTVDFNQAGSNKKLASCMFLPAPGELSFVSVPQ